MRRFAENGHGFVLARQEKMYSLNNTAHQQTNVFLMGSYIGHGCRQSNAANHGHGPDRDYPGSGFRRSYIVRGADESRVKLSVQNSLPSFLRRCSGIDQLDLMLVEVHSFLSQKEPYIEPGMGIQFVD